MKTTIRPATVEDARAIAALHVAAWRAAYRGLMPDALLEALSVDERARSRAEALARPQPGVSTWVLEGGEGGELLGFAVTGPVRDDDLDPARAGEVRAIYLAPDQVGRGHGRALMTHVLDDLRAGGFAEVVLWVLEGNERAERFYARAGFSPGKREVKHVSGFALPHARWTRAI